ncbi:hypothetical protein J4Q44_G00320840 [Coregonus suidteri]|uniref:Uncharacterized protein n=1 Tax=Coregonus suidteri TaxID=861788 RepID=A0AAN8QFW2_9TELE
MDMSEILESSTSDEEDKEVKKSEEEKELSSPSHDTSQAPQLPFQALAMVLPPQAPDRVPSNITTPPPFITKAQSNSGSKQRLSPFQDIEKAELQKKKILKEQFTKEYMKAKGLKDDPGHPLPL